MEMYLVRLYGNIIGGLFDTKEKAENYVREQESIYGISLEDDVDIRELTVNEGF